MESQVLPFGYGNKTKLEERLGDILGSGNFRVVERSNNHWVVLVSQKLSEVQIRDIRLYMKRHYSPTD
ncbi:hypothetical protein EDB82DRAFT_528336 [Fusarium venenatum]|uniref:uncharacterized protein n=1 Tax=Fusarium venenatum TaxID=56646 RepID=UPI001D562C3B|nr:hypothetical protein EDB82DRAFT_528336 [Fusarium venenatum]